MWGGQGQSDTGIGRADLVFILNNYWLRSSTTIYPYELKLSLNCAKTVNIMLFGVHNFGFMVISLSIWCCQLGTQIRTERSAVKHDWCPSTWEAGDLGPEDHHIFMQANWLVRRQDADLCLLPNHLTQHRRLYLEDTQKHHHLWPICRHLVISQGCYGPLDQQMMAPLYHNDVAAYQMLVWWTTSFVSF